MSASTGTGSRVDLIAGLRRVAAALAAGALAGWLIGGVGGRIAMLVLRLTSDPMLHGMQSDDGFTIGIVSSSTLFLLVATTVLGAIGGLVYLGVRSWLPERLRPWIFGMLAGLVGGSRVIRPGGVDFTLLDPLALALAMFVALPAAYGAATSLLAERFLREDSAFRGSRASFALLVFLLPIALSGPTGVLVLLAIAAAVAVVWMRPSLAGIWTSGPVTWLGRAALLVVGIQASVELARDVTTVL